MAARVNTKFVLIVVLTLGVVMALLGGMYVLKVRGDATRSYRKGQEAWDRGDFKAALDQFGRALHKDPGNAEYLRRAEESLLKLVPNNAGEAREMYTQHVHMMTHAVLHNPTNPDVHLRLLKELHAGARRINTAREWQALLQGAENMAQQVSDETGRSRARVYRALAISRLSGQRTDSEIAQALEDLELAVLALGPDDLAWSAKIISRLAQLNQFRIVGRSESAIEEARANLAKVVERAAEQVPNGPETARAILLYRMEEANRNRTPEMLAAARAQAERLISLLKPEDSSGLLHDSAALLELIPDGGIKQAAALLERVLEAQPGRHDLRATLASEYLRMNELEASEQHAVKVLEAPQLTVSFLALQQFDLRRQAASLLGDVEYRRWELAEPAQKAAQLEKAVKARDRLAGVVADVAADGLLLRADARLALARGDSAEAAQKFEQLVRLTNEKDVESLVFASIALSSVNQVGLAYERINKAVELSSSNTSLLLEKAKLELQMARPEDANRTIASLSEADLDTPHAKALVTAIRAALGGAPIPPDNPVDAAIAQANQALANNDTDTARAALLAALESNQEALPLLQALAQVEIRAGQRDDARTYVERGLQLRSEDPLLRQIDMALRYDDQVQATLEYLKVEAPEGKARAEATLVAMANLRDRNRGAAERLERQGKAAEAEKARNISQRAEAELKRAAEELDKIDPNNQRLLEHRFSTALAAKDWTAAEQLQGRARDLNVDEAGGLVYKGRLEIARGNYRDAAAALEQASEKLSFSSAVWRMLAIAYQNLGNFAQAERAYEQAYRCNPNDIAGTLSYVAILQRRGDRERALEILRGVVRLAPNNANLREAWLTLEAQVGSSATALHERETIHKDTPDDTENAAALAMLLVSLTPTRELLMNEDGEPLYSEDRWASLRGSERESLILAARNEWRKQSESIIADLEKALGDDLRVAVLRANVLRMRGDVVGGETTLREFISRHSANQTEDMFIELGRYQASVNHYADAVASLEQAVALNGPKHHDARINLALLLMQLRRHEEAITNLEAALAMKDDETVRLQIVECLINLKRFDEAEKRLGDTGSIGGSVGTLLAASIAEGRGNEHVLKGQVAEAERAFAQQRDLLVKAEQRDPGNPLPRVLMAQSLFREYQRSPERLTLLDDALQALDRAERIRAGNPQAVSLRVAILQAKGDRSGAVAQLRHLLELNPDNMNARRELIRMHVDGNDFTAAFAEIDAAVEHNPTIALWHEMRGDLIRSNKGDPRQAAAAFAKAHELEPTNGVLLKLFSTLMEFKPPDCRSAAERLAPQIEVSDDPLLREAYAQALNCLGQRDQAIEQLKLAYAARLNDPQPPRDAHSASPWFLAVGKIYSPEQSAQAEQLLMELSGGKPSVRELRDMARLWTRSESGMSRAVELQRQAVTLCPPEESALRASLNADLAAFLLGVGDLRGGADAYDVVLRIDPANVGAMNNLAYLRAEDLGEAPAALPLAERLVQLAPGDAPILDTVGWVYFKNGDLEKARQYLEQSVAIQPTVEAYVHLATVLAQAGNTAGAENQLLEAEKLRPNALLQQKINALRDDIKKNAGRAPGQ